MLHRQTLTPAPGLSWYDTHLLLPAIPFQWHNHAGFELTLTLASAGRRYLGERIDPYGSPDLVLIPPGMPHTWQSDADGGPHEIHVLVLPAGWANAAVDAGFTECLPLAALLDGHAIRFSIETAHACVPHFRALATATPLARLGLLFAIAAELVGDPARQSLGTGGFTAGRFDAQLALALDYLQAHYTEAITQSHVAAACGLSVASLKRRFKAGLGEPFGRYVQRLRIGHACRLLWGSALSVERIALDSGFPSVANFHRQFRSSQSMTPAQFRRQRPA
ncbi:AraC family transcriptional regulator [Jeongeupia wiesaeckerbachi]|uniref:helix-turn-helix domain-containing protein n=1 Tax=Jeongeupia wiesaeckerbachi TaxID=3051218 RepID=UPI003D8022CE